MKLLEVIASAHHADTWTSAHVLRLRRASAGAQVFAANGATCGCPPPPRCRTLPTVTRRKRRPSAANEASTSRCQCCSVRGSRDFRRSQPSLRAAGVTGTTMLGTLIPRTAAFALHTYVVHSTQTRMRIALPLRPLPPFIEAIAETYHDNAYHNFAHAVNVLHSRCGREVGATVCACASFAAAVLATGKHCPVWSAASSGAVDLSWRSTYSAAPLAFRRKCMRGTGSAFPPTQILTFSPMSALRAAHMCVRRTRAS
eukprot:1329349-Pleurochrysis_carterae.AAC.1